ncbi:hypothetical protein CEV32_1484 [Brucella rhizosphaerae]|uniref:Uncharacterized protein n=1 Tax=Brucella rhizosphaerae TaxID=571254 RepID=A0A256F903_9HYPH|nr:hypothetical protein CEV32_1484 [Brucella rhizosphaerae]
MRKPLGPSFVKRGYCLKTKRPRYLSVKAGDTVGFLTLKPAILPHLGL